MSTCTICLTICLTTDFCPGSFSSPSYLAIILSVATRLWPKNVLEKGTNPNQHQHCRSFCLNRSRVSIQQFRNDLFSSHSYFFNLCSISLFCNTHTQRAHGVFIASNWAFRLISQMGLSTKFKLHKNLPQRDGFLLPAMIEVSMWAGVNILVVPIISTKHTHNVPKPLGTGT